jgi:hypothetical protein
MTAALSRTDSPAARNAAVVARAFGSRTGTVAASVTGDLATGSVR